MPILKTGCTAKPPTVTTSASWPLPKGLSLTQRYADTPHEVTRTPSSNIRVRVKPDVVMQIRLAALPLLLLLLVKSRTGNIIVAELLSAEDASSMEKVRSPVDTTRITRLTPTDFSGLVGGDSEDDDIARDLRRRSSRGRPTDCNKNSKIYVNTIKFPTFLGLLRILLNVVKKDSVRILKNSLQKNTGIKLILKKVKTTDLQVGIKR